MLGRHTGGLPGEPVPGKARNEFVHRIMVMDTVAELNLLEIFQESLVFGVILVSGITGIYFFEKLAQGEIVTTVLVPEDVAPLEGGLA